MGMTTAAIYIPENPDLWSLLESLPHSLAPYQDHAMLLLHFVRNQRWSRKPDLQNNPGGYSNLNAKILRGYIPNRVLTPLKAFLKSEGVIETIGYSAGHHATGFRIRESFDGPPKRHVLTDPQLSAKLLSWWASYAKESSSSELKSVVESRRSILDHMGHSLSVLTLSEPSDEIVADAVAGGVDSGHARYVCLLLDHRDHRRLTVDEFGRRVHSIVTMTSKVIRSFYQLQGESIVEIDVQNSQPILLAMQLARHKPNPTQPDPSPTHPHQPPTPHPFTPFLLCGASIGYLTSRIVNLGSFGKYVRAAESTKS